MAKPELLATAKDDPVRIFRTPANVLRDRRFGPDERAEVLAAWKIIAANAEDAETLQLCLDAQRDLRPQLRTGAQPTEDAEE
jgi:hypothetical protein